MTTPLLLQPAEMLDQAAPGTKPAPQPAAPSDAPAAPGSVAPNGSGPPPGQGGPLGGMGMMILLPLVLIGVMWFMSRSEKKRRSSLEDGLKKGDRVLTRSGIAGKLMEVGETKVKVEIAPGVTVTMVKQAVEGLDEPRDVKKPAKTDAEEEDGAKKKTKK